MIYHIQLKNWANKNNDERKQDLMLAQNHIELLKEYNIRNTDINKGQIDVEVRNPIERDTDPTDKNGISFIDLKPYFAAHAKQSKNGGWYTRVPVNLRNGIKKSSPVNKILSTANYVFSPLTPSTTISLDDLDKRTKVARALRPIIDKNGGKINIQGAINATNGNVNPVMFRTVSNRSAPDKWIVKKYNPHFSQDDRNIDSPDFQQLNLFDNPPDQR